VAAAAAAQEKKINSSSVNCKFCIRCRFRQRKVSSKKRRRRRRAPHEGNKAHTGACQITMHLISSRKGRRASGGRGGCSAMRQETNKSRRKENDTLIFVQMGFP